MGEPVFTEADKVASTTSPPQPTRIVTAPPESKRDKTAFWNDPEKTTREIVQEEANRIVTQMAHDPATQTNFETQVQAAKYVMQQKYGNKFTQFADEIEKIVRQTPGPQMANVGFWETCFNFVRGQNFDKAVQEAEVRGKLPAEPVAAAAREPEKPKEISHIVDPDARKSEAQVADGLGLSPEAFLRGKENMNKDIFPFTYDNRRRRK